MKIVLQGTVKGARRRGRHKKRWEDNIKEWTRMEFGDSLRAAEDREEWKGIVATSPMVPRRPPRLRDWDEMRYDGKVQIYFSAFEARRNYKVHRLSRDFEVLLCPDCIKFAQSVWATSRQNLSSDLKLKSTYSVSEASHLGYNKFR